MIYNIIIKNDLGQDKQFYLTADTHSQLYHRAASTYGVTKDKITILEEYKETNDGYEFVKKYVDYKKDSEYSEDAIKRAKAAYADQKMKCDPSKTDYKTRHNMTEIPITGERDVYELAETYKTIKVYWETTEEKGVHRLYALVK